MVSELHKYEQDLNDFRSATPEQINHPNLVYTQNVILQGGGTLLPNKYKA
jgi:hypothetical protein